MNQRILVTGAAGFIGSHTVDRLLSLGAEVIGVDDFSTGQKGNLSEALEDDKFRIVELNIAEAGAFSGLCEEVKPDAIIHLAGLVSVIRADAEPDENYRLNIRATYLVAEAARIAGVKRVVFASSAATYGENSDLPLSEAALPAPINLYGNAKTIGERLLLGHAHTFGFTAICLRYFNVYGKRQDPASPYSGVISIFSDRMSRGEAVTIFGDGEQTRDFISVKDLAVANSIAATKEGLESTICNVCTGRQQTLNELAAVLEGIFPEGGPVAHAEARAGEIIHSCGDPARAEEVLGFTAAVSLDEGLRDLLS